MRRMIRKRTSRIMMISRARVVERVTVMNINNINNSD